MPMPANPVPMIRIRVCVVIACTSKAWNLLGVSYWG